MKIPDTTLTCRELVELVSEYVEGELPPRDRAVLEQHLLICSGCREYLAQVRLTVREAGALREPLRESQIPEPIKADLFRAFRALRAGAPTPGDGES